jgi:hypothetical protein
MEPAQVEILDQIDFVINQLEQAHDEFMES